MSLTSPLTRESVCFLKNPFVQGFSDNILAFLSKRKGKAADELTFLVFLLISFVTPLYLNTLCLLSNLQRPPWPQLLPIASMKLRWETGLQHESSF